MPISIALTVECDAVPLDEARLRAAVNRVFADASIPIGQVGVAVLTDAAIRQLNKQYLDHDYATDAISFLLERGTDYVEGEIAVSAETAQREAAHYGWPATDELLLYVVHGALHLVGGNDTTPGGAAEMRRREREVLATLGLTPPWEDDQAQPTRSAGNRRRQEGFAR